MQNPYHDMMILQSWFSPAFPTGAFSYSHGLETAIQDRLVGDADSLLNWITNLLIHGSGWNDALFIKAAYEREEGVNDLCLALCASKERRQETLELGQSFSRVVNNIYQLSLADGLAYPVAVGLAAQAKDLDLPLTIQSYLQAFAANLISVGVRTIPIGQHSGQHCLVGLYPDIDDVAKKVIKASLDELGSATMLSDLMAMKHENSIPRIYRT